MVDEFFLIHLIDGVERKREKLSRKDIKQVAEGLRYASVRDSVSDRRKHYLFLNKIFWRMMR